MTGLDQTLPAAVVGITKMEPNMFIVKRDGRKQAISFDKITRRITSLCNGLDMTFIDPLRIVKSVIEGLFSGAKTSQLDTLAAEVCASLSNVHHDYSTLAARIEISNLHKQTSASFVETARKLYGCQRDGEHTPMVTKTFLEDVEYHGDKLDAAIDYTRDYDFGYFAIKTLQKSYLLKYDGQIIERPQHMLMRVAVALHGRNLDAIVETYEAMSTKKFIHASPTLFNAGCPRNGMSSCFLVHTPDSIEGIFDSIKECAVVSALSGGIGINVSEIRSKGSLIKSTGGQSEGIIPLLKVLNDTALFVTQSSKRPGAIAVYIEPHHPEILAFLEMKRLNGREDMRARDLFYALWISDLFMEQVEKDGDWCLFCPGECPGLATAYGDEYRKLYAQYEAEGKYRKKIKARDVWEAMVKSQIESGSPYVLFKDRINTQNNQAHYGTIRNSNLCSEIVLYCDDKETAVCILASACLPSYVTKRDDGTKYFDHDELARNVRIMTRNLNNVIDITKYPNEKSIRSNTLHRPIAIGVSGLQDTFLELKMAFDSPEARQLNNEISETIYYAAVSESCELAKIHGAYSTFPGSEFSKGHFQFDLAKNNNGRSAKMSGRWDWDALRRQVIQYGTRNSLLTGYMPTASTSTILGVSECIEPLHGVIYMRRTMSGEFQMINKYLVNDLVEAGLWNETTKNLIIQNRGSVQEIGMIPEDIRRRYKTVWQLPQKVLIDMAADRQLFTDQTQSMNLFKAQPTYAAITSMLMYGWKQGLKTGMYYMRSQPRVAALQFTQTKVKTEGPVCTMEEGCLSCSG